MIRGGTGWSPGPKGVGNGGPAGSRLPQTRRQQVGGGVGMTAPRKRGTAIPIQRGLSRMGSLALTFPDRRAEGATRSRRSNGTAQSPTHWPAARPLPASVSVTHAPTSWGTSYPNPLIPLTSPGSVLAADEGHGEPSRIGGQLPTGPSALGFGRQARSWDTPARKRSFDGLNLSTEGIANAPLEDQGGVQVVVGGLSSQCDNDDSGARRHRLKTEADGGE